MSNIESILKETRSFPVPDEFRHKASVSGVELITHYASRRMIITFLSGAIWPVN